MGISMEDTQNSFNQMTGGSDNAGTTVKGFFDPIQGMNNSFAAGKAFVNPKGGNQAQSWWDQHSKAPSPNYGSVNTIGQLGQDRYDATMKNNQGLDAADTAYANASKDAGGSYVSSMQAQEAAYKSKLQGLSDQATKQSSDATATYNNNLQPKMQTMLDHDSAEAYGGTYGGQKYGGAMSLDDAGDPNNKVQSAVREMYNQQGANAQNQGLAASSVMGSLGAQNAASAFGSQGPMSVGQQQALYAASQGQAGQAFAKAQQQMNNLRQQGIMQGFNESNAQYDRGQAAKGMAQGDIGRYQGMQNNYLNQTGSLRNEVGGYQNQMSGADAGITGMQRDYNMGMAQLGRNGAYSSANRNTAAANELYGNKVGIENAKMGINNASGAAQGNAMGGLGSAVGGVVGAIFGGSSGMAGGAKGGNAVGNAAAPSGDNSGGTQYSQYGQPPPNQGYSPYGPYSGGYQTGQNGGYGGGNPYV